MPIRTSSRRLAAAVVAALSIGMASAPAFALTLEEARVAGLVLEANTGFLVARSDRADVLTLVQTINQQRQAAYQEIAQRNSQPIDAVAVTAAQDLVSRLPPGTYYQTPTGQIQQR